MKFNGVGNKIANLFMKYGYSKNIGVAVDTHVHRISNRIGWVKSTTPDETMNQLH